MISRVLSLALILLLALPAVVLGASATSQETLTIEPTVTITGVPATIDYGSGLGGTRLTATPFTIVASTNSMTGASFRTDGSGFAMDGGADSFGANARLFVIGEVGPADFTAYDEEGVFQGIASAPGAGSYPFTVTLAVDLPETNYPGAYTGTVTFSWEINPAP